MTDNRFQSKSETTIRAIESELAHIDFKVWEARESLRTADVMDMLDKTPESGIREVPEDQRERDMARLLRIMRESYTIHSSTADPAYCDEAQESDLPDETDFYGKDGE